MLQALRQNAARARIARGDSMPAPVEGWDAISPLSEMKPTRAVVLDNWFPQPGYVEVRKGYSSWSTGMGSSTAVESLLVYNGLTTASSKLYGVAGGTIYDCTANAAATSTGVTTLTNSRWQYVNYTTSANTAYLWAVNGADTAKMYDGASWSTPSVTGTTSDNFIHVNVYKKRIWAVINGSMDAAYLGLDSISGAATKFPLGSVMGSGGFLMAMATWTRDGGAGPDDYAVFISSMGQVAVYTGDVSSTFSLIGVYHIPPPIGRRCFLNVGGDLAVVTVSGIVPLSKAITQDQSAEATVALTFRINNAMNVYAQSYKGNFGWEFTAYPLGTAAILNVPITENGTAYQLVMNTLTGAWCRFTGWNMNCFAVFKDVLYAGSNVGVVYKMWTGSIDGSTQIDATGQCAYSYFGMHGLTKRYTALQPLITTDQTIVPQFGISTDFRDNATLATPSAVSTASALYDAAIWDTDVYAIEGRSAADWTTISGIGQCASLHFRQSTSSTGAITVQFNGYNITFEVGDFY